MVWPTMPQTRFNIAFPSMEQQSSLVRRDTADCYPSRQSSRSCAANRQTGDTQEMPKVRGHTQRRRQTCKFHSFSTPFSTLAAISEDAETEPSDEEHTVSSEDGREAFNTCSTPSGGPLASRFGVNIWTWADKAIDVDEEKSTMTTNAVEMQQVSCREIFRNSGLGSCRDRSLSTTVSNNVAFPEANQSKPRTTTRQLCQLEAISDCAQSQDQGRTAVMPDECSKFTFENREVRSSRSIMTSPDWVNLLRSKAARLSPANKWSAIVEAGNWARRRRNSGSLKFFDGKCESNGRESSDLATHVALNDYAKEVKIEIAKPLLPVVGLQGDRKVCRVLLKEDDMAKV